MMNHAPRYAGLEIMAQAAALHVRRRMKFERHAFLLSAQRCTLPQVDDLKGLFQVKAVLRHRSSEAFSYDVAAFGPDDVDFESELLIGTRAFDDRLPKEALTAHYQHLWVRLKEES